MALTEVLLKFFDSVVRHDESVLVYRTESSRKLTNKKVKTKADKLEKSDKRSTKAVRQRDLLEIMNTSRELFITRKKNRRQEERRGGNRQLASTFVQKLTIRSAIKLIRNSRTRARIKRKPWSPTATEGKASPGSDCDAVVEMKSRIQFVVISASVSIYYITLHQLHPFTVYCKPDQSRYMPTRSSPAYTHGSHYFTQKQLVRHKILSSSKIWIKFQSVVSVDLFLFRSKKPRQITSNLRERPNLLTVSK